MSLFSGKTNNSRNTPSSSPTFISREMEVTGDFKSNGAMQVEGILYGNITVDSVVIGKEGQVYGNIIATNSLILGRVDGDITVSKKLDIESTGYIQGNIKQSILVIAEGATIIGSIKENPKNSKDS